MSWNEHTPHIHEMRDTAELPVPLNSSEDTIEPATETPAATDETITTTIHTREIHLYTIPNRGTSGHYADSGLYRDVIKNPALYMDHADF